MRPGDLVAERFVVERLAGSGGMGSVFRARDRHEGGSAALKVLHEGVSTEDERFVREARILAELRHPGIVRYLAHGVTLAGERWLALEWLEGEDLHQRLSREPLTTQDSVMLVRRAAEALAVAHARGIIHRDIKPSNLFLPRGETSDSGDSGVGRLKLLDFGIARLDRSTHAATRTGALLGTPGYMAPEQARGERDLDARADLFALGCVLFECLTGRPPFVGDNPMVVMAKILVEDAPRARELRPELSPALDDLVARVLSKKREDRPPDAATFLTELDALGSFSGVGAGRPKISDRPPELTGGEQRLQSVVLVGSGTEIDAGTAPTMASDSVQGPAVLLRTVVAPYGGRVDPLADGTLVVTLPGAAAATDQASRAARCAIAIRSLVPQLPMALATGRGLAGSRWPVGEAIERAVELLNTAKKTELGDDEIATIRIDEITASLLDARFAVEADPDGHALRGERDAPDTVRKLLGKPTPFVGRERELSMLQAIFAECVGDSVAHAVLITAPAGAGKSRLRDELVRRLRKDESTVGLVIGRGDPMSAGSPFALLAPALRRAAEIRDDEELAVKQHKLRDYVSRHVRAADLIRVTEFLGELMSVPFDDEESLQLRVARQDPTLMGDQMRRAFEDFLEAECSAHPLVLVLEDLHWGDVPTVRFVEAALRHLADKPLLVLALARPEVREIFPRLLTGRALTELQLGELSKKASERLVREALGKEVASDVVERIVDRAAGNAFFLEELIRAVADPRMPTPSARDTPRNSRPSDDLPETVLAVAQARLDRLDPEARRLLRAASVFGKVFWRGGLSALVGAQRISQVADWLAVMVEQELIERRGGPRFLGEDEYVFRHALVRDAAYSMLTDQDRTLGHRLAAEWLERVGESDATLLAEHFERGNEPARAVGWLRRGAEQALEGHDFASAIARAERGLASGARGEVRGALELVRAEAHRWRGEYPGAEASAIAATMDLAEGSAPWFRAIEELMNTIGRRGDYPDALSVADRGESATPLEGTTSAQLMCLCAAARLRLHAGQYPRADEIIDRVVPMTVNAARLDPRAVAEVHRLRGARARHVGDLVGDVTGYLAALASFELAGDVRNACNAQVSLGFAYIEIGLYARAGEELQAGLAAAKRLGLSSVAARARQNLGLVHAARGELERARTLEAEVVETSAAQGNVRFEAWSRIYLSSILLRADDPIAAESEAHNAAELLRTTPPARAGALAALARALTAQGRAHEALPHAREAMEILDSLGGIEEFELSVRLAHAEALQASGEEEAAKKAVLDARARILRVAESLRDPIWRQSYLQAIAENARILELAGAWE